MGNKGFFLKKKEFLKNVCVLKLSYFLPINE